MMVVYEIERFDSEIERMVVYASKPGGIDIQCRWIAGHGQICPRHAGRFGTISNIIKAVACQCGVRHRQQRTYTQQPRKHCARRKRSEEHTSELQSLMRISYAVFCLNTKTHKQCIITMRTTKLTQ